MKRLILTGFLLAVAAACGSARTAREAEVETPTLQCASCEVTIQKAVERVDGVSSVKVDGENRVVKVSYTEEATNVAAIETAIAIAGYQANDKQADPKAYEKLPDCCKADSGAH